MAHMYCRFSSFYGSINLFLRGFLLFYITAGFYHIYHIVTQFLAFGDNIYIVNSRNMPLIIF